MGDRMDVKKLIGKTLKPARPIRHGVSEMANGQRNLDSKPSCQNGLQRQFPRWVINSANLKLTDTVTPDYGLLYQADIKEFSAKDIGKEIRMLRTVNEVFNSSVVPKKQEGRPRMPNAIPEYGVNYQLDIKEHRCKDTGKAINMLYTVNNNVVLNNSVVTKEQEGPRTLNKKDRITYSRELLIELSCLSVSRRRPSLLPDHPVVLDKPVIMLQEVKGSLSHSLRST